MVNHHHHHHHPGGTLAGEGPLDAANQSLADALRASFGILKFVMIVLVIMYCVSGVQCIEEHEQAVVFRFGKLLPGVRGSGLSWAFPYPIDETLRFPTRKDNTFTSTTHWPKVKADLRAEPLSASTTPRGLDPAQDGALLTSDRGLVHAQWRITYSVEDLRNYVLHVADRDTGAVEDLITNILEQTAIHIVSMYTAEEVTRARSSEIAESVRATCNQRLAEIESGIRIKSVDIPRSSVPGKTIPAFDAVARAENEKQAAIRQAEQRRLEILNGMAGAVHDRLLALIDQLDAARRAQRDQEVSELRARIDAMLETEVSGYAGERINQARGFYTQAVQRIRGDVQQYQAVLDEYLTAPELFINRMWKATRRKVLQYDGVTKNLLPPGADEVRIHVGPDPKQREIEERKKLEEEAKRYRYQSREHARINP